MTATATLIVVAVVVVVEVFAMVTVVVAVSMVVVVVTFGDVVVDTIVAVVMVFLAVVSAVVTMHAVDDIDPEEPVNMPSFVAFDSIQETPQSIWVKDMAPLNIPLISVTADTSHADRLWLKDRA